MAGPEKKVENLIKSELKRLGIWSFKLAASEMMAPGIPDIIACVNGKFVGIEVKAPGKLYNTSPAQKVQHELIRKSGGTVIVTDDFEDFLVKINEVLNGRVRK